MCSNFLYLEPSDKCGCPSQGYSDGRIRDFFERTDRMRQKLEGLSIVISTEVGGKHEVDFYVTHAKYNVMDRLIYLILNLVAETV